MFTSRSGDTVTIGATRARSDRGETLDESVWQGRSRARAGHPHRQARCRQDEFLKDPEAAIRELKSSDTRVDVFTFMQDLQHTTPLYDYPMEQDNLAALPVSSYDHWFAKQIDNKTRNMVGVRRRRASPSGKCRSTMISFEGFRKSITNRRCGRGNPSGTTEKTSM